MPRSTQEDWAPLRSLLCKLMVSFMDTKFHPYEFLTLRLVCVLGRGFWRKRRMLSISAPKRSINTTAPKSFISPLCDTHHQEVASEKASISRADSKGWVKKHFLFKESIGILQYIHLAVFLDAMSSSFQAPSAL